MAHELTPLPYREDALAPHLSEETLQFHYGKHHRGYVEKLNKLIAGTPFDGMRLEETVRKSSGDVFNNAAQVWNHTFYWSCLSPDGGGEPEGAVAEAIDGAFESFDKFREQFGEAAGGLFGSGWVWLVRNKDGSLAIEQMENAKNPLKTGQSAILTCDVWEHAYYIDYRNERERYVEAFWKLVNWEFAERNLSAVASRSA